MASILFVCCGGLILSMSDAGAVTVRVGVIDDVAPGTASATVPIDLELAGNESVGGIQADLTFDPAIVAFKSAVAGQVVVDAGKRVSSVALTADTERFFVAGLNQNAISAGTVILVEFSLDALAAPGPSILFLSNLRVVSPTGLTIAATAEPGAINVAGEEPVEGVAPVDGETPPEGDPVLEGENPTEGEVPVEGNIPAEGDVSVEGEIVAEGAVASEGDTPDDGNTARGCSGGTIDSGGTAGGGNTIAILLTVLALLCTPVAGHLHTAAQSASGRELATRD